MNFTPNLHVVRFLGIGDEISDALKDSIDHGVDRGKLIIDDTFNRGEFVIDQTIQEVNKTVEKFNMGLLKTVHRVDSILDSNIVKVMDGVDSEIVKVLNYADTTLNKVDLMRLHTLKEVDLLKEDISEKVKMHLGGVNDIIKENLSGANEVGEKLIGMVNEMVGSMIRESLVDVELIVDKAGELANEIVDKVGDVGYKLVDKVENVANSTVDKIKREILNPLISKISELSRSIMDEFFSLLEENCLKLLDTFERGILISSTDAIAEQFQKNVEEVIKRLPGIGKMLGGVSGEMKRIKEKAKEISGTVHLLKTTRKNRYMYTKFWIFYYNNHEQLNGLYNAFSCSVDACKNNMALEEKSSSDMFELIREKILLEKCLKFIERFKWFEKIWKFKNLVTKRIWDKDCEGLVDVCEKRFVDGFEFSVQNETIKEVYAFENSFEWLEKRIRAIEEPFEKEMIISGITMKRKRKTLETSTNMEGYKFIGMKNIILSLMYLESSFCYCTHVISALKKEKTTTFLIGEVEKILGNRRHGFKTLVDVFLEVEKRKRQEMMNVIALYKIIPKEETKTKSSLKEGESMYTGELFNNLYHGKGSLILKRGGKLLIYQGDFKSGRKSGECVECEEVWNDDDEIEGENEEESTKSRLKKWNVYKGEYKTISVRDSKNNEKFFGMREGSGVEKFSSGDEYVGQWENGVLRKGVCYLHTGNVYNGEFIGENHSREGEGTIFFGIEDKKSYETELGNYRNGVFEGTWNNNSMLKGRLRFDCGKDFVGRFRNNRMQFDEEGYVGFKDKDLVRNGYGILKVDKDMLYKGQFQDGKRCGVGIIVKTVDKDSESMIYKGEWLNDKRHGYGILTTEKDYYEGQWKEDLKDGYGKTQLTGNIDAQFVKNEKKCDIERGNMPKIMDIRNLGDGKRGIQYSNGSIFEGTVNKLNQWIHGVFIGKWNYTDSKTGIEGSYDGTFEFGKMCGQGSLISFDGTIVFGDRLNNLMSPNRHYYEIKPYGEMTKKMWTLDGEKEEIKLLMTKRKFDENLKKDKSGFENIIVNS